MGEVEIDEELVRSLLREQHPDLADHDLRPPVTGWDDRLWRLGEKPAVIRRARGWAVRGVGLILILIGEARDQGLSGGKPTWGPAGRRALDRVLVSA